MIGACRHRHDGRGVLVAAEAGQSTSGQPDRDTESIIGVGPARDTLEVGDVQSVKHVESTAPCKLPSCSTGLWNVTLVGIVGWSHNVRGSIR